MKNKRILLVGCGQLGSRHLQAISALEEVTEVIVVDPAKESILLGRKRIAEVQNGNPRIRYVWLESLNETIAPGELCIIATHSTKRPQLIKEVAELGYKNFIIEKIVAQSVKEYEDLLGFSSEAALSIWVNCQCRTYQINRYIKSKIKPDESLSMANIGGNQGLASAGIHYADLFLFFDGSKELKTLTVSVDPILHTTRRSKDLYDLSGILAARSERGSTLLISYAQTNMGPDYMSIMSPSYKCIIDQYSKLTAYESSIDTQWSWKQVPIEEEYYISKSEGKIISDVLKKGSCDLPTLEQSFPAHKFILEALLPSFNRLLKKNTDHCPVT